MLKRQWRVRWAVRGEWSRRKSRLIKKFGTYCAVIRVATRLKWNEYRFRKPQANIDQMMKSNDENDDNTFSRIQFDSFRTSIFIFVDMNVNISFLFTFVRMHLTNSLTGNSWQWNIRKYCSHLLVFVGDIRICKFDACRHLPNFGFSMHARTH